MRKWVLVPGPQRGLVLCNGAGRREMSEIITGVERTICRGRGQTPATVDDYCWHCRQRAAYKKLAAANTMNAIDSIATSCALPTPIVAQRRQSICHVIGFASAAARNHFGSGSRG